MALIPSFCKSLSWLLSIACMRSRPRFWNCPFTACIHAPRNSLLGFCPIAVAATRSSRISSLYFIVMQRYEKTPTRQRNEIKKRLCRCKQVRILACLCNKVCCFVFLPVQSLVCICLVVCPKTSTAELGKRVNLSVRLDSRCRPIRQ